MPRPIIAIGIRATNAGDGEAQPARGGEQIAVGPEHAAHGTGPGRRSASGTACEDQPVSATDAAPRRSTTPRRTTPCCWCPSAGPRVRTTCCRSSRTSPAAAGSRASGCSRWGSTTSASAGSARSTRRTARWSRRCEADFAAHGAATCRSTGATATGRPTSPTSWPGSPTTAAAGCSPCSPRPTRRTPGCRQYRENLAAAVAPLGDRAPAGRPGAALLQPPGLRRGDGDEHASRPLDELPADVRARRPAGVRHALGADVDGRDQRAGRRRVRRAAPRRGPAWSPPGSRPRPAPTTSSTSSTAAAAARRPSRGWSRTSTTTSSRSSPTASRRPCWCRSASSPTTWR